MGLAQLSCAITGVPVTEMLVGGGPVGASAAAAGDPGGGADDVRTGALRRLHDLGGGAVDLLVVVALEPDPDLLLCHARVFP